MSLLAIDFGTSRIKAAYWNDKRGEAVMLPLGDGGRLYVPSLFYVNREGKIRFGDEAKAMLFHDPQGVVENLKLKLGKPLQNLPNNRQAASSELMALLFRNIIQHSVQEVKGFRGKPPEKIVLTYPALLDYTTIYKDALRAAGYRGEESYIREPEAAGWAWLKEEKREPGEVLVVLDFGGGTVDWATLCVDEKCRPRMVADLPASGITAAGVDVDQGLFEEMMKHINEGQKSYAMANRARVIEQIRQMKESQNGRSLLSGKESQMLEVQLGEQAYLFDRKVFQEVVKREALDQALVSIEGYLKKVVKHQHENGGRKQIWCVLVGGTRLLSGLEEQVKQRVKETGKAGGIEIQFAEIEQADFATVRGAVSQFFAVDEKIPTPEVFAEKARISKAPVAEPVTQPVGNHPDKRKEDPDTVYYGRTKEDIPSYWRVGVIFFIALAIEVLIILAVLFNGRPPLILLFIMAGVMLAICVAIVKNLEAAHCKFHLNSSFDSLKEKLLNTKSYDKQKFAITELDNGRLRVISSIITWNSISGLSFSANVLLYRSDNGNTVMICNNQKGVKFIRKNINPKAVFVLRNN